MLPGIGVFGTGTAVKCLVPILKSCGFKVEALWGCTREQADEVSKELQINFSTEKVDEVLLHKGVDLVFIHCPPHQQSPIAVKALGIGKHVICGTPAGPSQLDALRMVNAAQYYPSLMSVMCNGMRFLSCFVKMKEMIDDGYIGEATACEARVQCGSLLNDKYDWMCDDLMGGGVLNIYGSPIIDLISFLVGQKAAKVQAMLKTFTKQTEKINGIRQITSDDFCCLQMELTEGACATITLNNHVPSQFVHELLICGTKGRLVVRNTDLFGQKHEDSNEDLLYEDTQNIPDEIKTGITETTDIPETHLKGLMKLVDSVKDAFECVEEKHGWSKEPVTVAATFEDGQYVQTVVDAARESNKKREWVAIKLMSEEPDPNPLLSAAVRRSTFSLY